VPNRLIREKSPYLRQHADNPVQWYPWGEEAFAAAVKLDRPIFLSIGYSSCHWCHVMEKESFVDHEVARLLNDSFISIKVDREERPDVDAHFLAACQMLGGGGGWPLTVFLTPERQPFLAGTYFPKEGRFGLIGFKDLVRRIAEAWTARRGDLVNSAQQVAAALRQTGDAPTGGPLSAEILDRAFAELRNEFDPGPGGFGRAPKFPLPHRLAFLLRYADRAKNRAAAEMVEKTLAAMRSGGIFDHLGFGFHRYATDSDWRVPHFEKMLYDQALLMIAYSEAYQLTRRPEFRRTVEDIAAYVGRNLTSEDGGFFTAEDADSEGEEGRFYLWEAEEVRSSLTPVEADLAFRAFGLRPEGNSGGAEGPLAGKNILYLSRPPALLASELGVSERELGARLEAVRAKLLEVRGRRPRPLKDTKILTDWNGLMIAALARAAGALGEGKYARAARRAAEFVRRKMNPGARLCHRYAGGEVAVPAFLDDYAFLIWGLVELYEAGFEAGHLAWALRLTDRVTDQFWDKAGGGYFFTSDESRDLPFRKKDIYDGAVPSGNSVMFGNLLRLGRLTGRAELERRAGEIADAFAGWIGRTPAGSTQFLCGLDFALGPTHEIVIAGRPGASDTRRLLASLRRKFLPRTTVVFRPADQESPAILELAPQARAAMPVDGRAAAYVCSHFRCENPTTDPRRMLELLSKPAS
jgi:uncharacterized protein YyaL (SSP411 family)